MWHRRLFNRPHGRLLMGRSRRTLRRAFQLMERGDHASAASLFEGLARQALDVGMDRRATYMFLQAARANFLSDQPEIGLGLAQEGLQVMVTAGALKALRDTGDRLVSELESWGFGEQSQKLNDWLEAQFSGKSSTPQTITQSTRQPRLPNVCPQCGAPARPDEVEWLDDRTAACTYCGSILSSD